MHPTSESVNELHIKADEFQHKSSIYTRSPLAVNLVPLVRCLFSVSVVSPSS